MSASAHPSCAHALRLLVPAPPPHTQPHACTRTRMLARARLVHAHALRLLHPAALAGAARTAPRAAAAHTVRLPPHHAPRCSLRGGGGGRVRWARRARGGEGASGRRVPGPPPQPPTRHTPHPLPPPLTFISRLEARTLMRSSEPLATEERPEEKVEEEEGGGAGSGCGGGSGVVSALPAREAGAARRANAQRQVGGGPEGGALPSQSGGAWVHKVHPF